MSEQKTTELIQRYYNGEQGAVSELFSEYRHKVFNYIYATVKERDVANDLVQETFIKVFLSLERRQYREDGRFEPWLIRIARNVVMDYFREKKRDRHVYANDDNYLNSAHFQCRPEEGLPSWATKEVRGEVRRLVQRLPDSQREVVILRMFVGLSFQEIADHTEVSINTALGRMRYALINMRKLAKADEHCLMLG